MVQDLVSNANVKRALEKYPNADKIEIESDGSMHEQQNRNAVAFDLTAKDNPPRSTTRAPRSGGA